MSLSFALPWPVLVTLCALLVALGVVVVRLVTGPSLADRVVALDVLAYIAVGVIAAYAVGTGTPALLDAALVLALVAFLGTVAFARFVERRGPVQRRDPA